jgi:hypothetical protein
MSKRIKTPQSLGRDYKKMLKDYFGKYLYGLEVNEKGGRVMVQLVYYDFKHISNVRRDLAQMMPEVEFTKIKRDFTHEAETWALSQLLWEECCSNIPTIYVQHGDNIVKSSLHDIAFTELNRTELEDGDVYYGKNSELRFCQNLSDKKLESNSWD